MIWLIVGIVLGYTLCSNSQQKTIAKTDEQLAKELAIAKNLNESLLADKHDLQERLWKLEQKATNVKARRSKSS